MKVIIAGSRNIIWYHHIEDAVTKSQFNINQVVSGGARGADRFGEMWAKKNGRDLKIFPAEWNKYGKKAGYLRNVEMADYADALIAIWDGESKGTAMMIDIAKKKGLEVYIHETK